MPLLKLPFESISSAKRVLITYVYTFPTPLFLIWHGFNRKCKATKFHYNQGSLLLETWLFLAPLSDYPSVRLSVDLSRFVSAWYLWNPWWDFRITLHTCQVWWVNVQGVCLIKVSSRSRSMFKVKHCMTLLRVRSIYSSWRIGDILKFKWLCTNVKYRETMCRVRVWPKSLQCQGHSLRLNLLLSNF